MAVCHVQRWGPSLELVLKRGAQLAVIVGTQDFVVKGKNGSTCARRLHIRAMLYNFRQRRFTSKWKSISLGRTAVPLKTSILCVHFPNVRYLWRFSRSDG